MKQSNPTDNTADRELWVAAAKALGLDDEDHEDDEQIQPLFDVLKALREHWQLESQIEENLTYANWPGTMSDEGVRTVAMRRVEQLEEQQRSKLSQMNHQLEDGLTPNQRMEKLESKLSTNNDKEMRDEQEQSIPSS